MPIRLFHLRILVLVFTVFTLISCGSDRRPATDAGSDSGSDGSSDSGTDGGTSTGSDGGTDDGTPASTFSLELSSGSISVQEGDGSASVTVTISRLNNYSGNIQLSALGESAADQQRLGVQISDTNIDASESSSNITLNVDYSNAPILAQNRTIIVSGQDDNNQFSSVALMLGVVPTDRPDIYLLAGQSNMVGFSEGGAKAADPGEPDEPNSRIQQLNVTGNGPTNFPDGASFSDPAAVAVSEPRYVAALDPLHNGYDVSIQGKEGDYIGLGLSFAKRALPDTSSAIVLVPAAWSNTGFCERDDQYIANLGWLPSPVDNPVLSGTLLYERALTRTNIVINETGGILRGILWHQGEADSDDINCAANYEQNLQNLVAALRANIVQDARGPGARGSSSDVPFVVGTMSRGAEFIDFPDEKVIVDTAHRNVPNSITYAGVVINDDLVPDAYPCGQGSCIHFGARSYREMGVRYYDQLKAVSQQ